MSEDTQPDPLTPAGFMVHIVDLSAESDADRVVETVSGFTTLEHANAFARAYVRDSIDICREGDSEAAADVLSAWGAFGEDVEVMDPSGEPAAGGWHSTMEAATFAATPSDELERNWRALDPRGSFGLEDLGSEDEGEGGVDGDDALDEELIPPTILVDLPPRKLN